MSWMCQCPREIPDGIPLCGSCGMDRPHTVTLSSKCDDCHEPTRQVQLTPGEDERNRCASCHVDYLRQRMFRDPIRDEDLARCKDRLSAAYAGAAIKWASTRIGQQPRQEA
jgi:hypothetical protein